MAQLPAPGWDAALIKLLTEQDQVCQQSVVNCNIFVGRALRLVWGVKDFERPSPSEFLTANAIADALPTSTHWRRLGVASNQSTARSAQDHANSNGAVLAIWKNPKKAADDPKRHGHGHVALIVPSDSLFPSPKWGICVPSAASFVMNDLQSSFIGGPLSKAFGADIKDEVELWVRDQN
jgi:hypothetical protein